MKATRLEAYSDAVIAIVITIMVLELHVPESASLEALGAVLPTFLAYVLSFVFLSIYWNNHHHLIQATQRINGAIMWANIHLLFWLSLVPFTTAWLSRYPSTAWPAAIYGIDLIMAAVAYTILARAIVRDQGPDSALAAALGRDIKGKASLGLYLAAIAAAFWLPALAYALYVVVALMWLVPDRRIEARLTGQSQE